MTKTAAHLHIWETFEAVFGIMFLIGVILSFLFPLPLSRWLPRGISIGVGMLLLLSGLAILVETRRQFRQTGQPTAPGMPTTQLMTSGIFSWSRNPLYLSGVVIFASLGLLLNSAWLLILLIPTIAAVHMILIAPEERYLKENFGEPYHQYLHSVRRWVGRYKG